MKRIAAASENLSLYSRRTLFQFIVSEFVLAHQHVELLNGSIAEPKGKETMKQLLASFSSHSSGSYAEGSHLSIHCDDNSFAKLVYYCALWDRLEEKGDGHTLRKKSYKAWLLHFELQCIFGNSNLFDSSESAARNWHACQAIVIRLNGLMALFMHALADLFFYFSRDENVLFFLLCYREQLDALYGTGFVARWLERSFFGLDKAVHFLHARYAKRGFVQLLPVISDKIVAAKASL